MKKQIRYFLLISYPFLSLGSFILVNYFLLKANLADNLIDWTFLITLFLYVLTIEEFYQWAKNGKRSEMSDIVAILFFFFLIFFFSKDFLTSIMGAFSIYLWVGIYELRDYPILNKVLIISLITYNVIFIAGLISYYLNDPFYINTSFAFSFWIILILGFLLFGRKYVIVWRFMSPEYLTLFLYIIAWLAVVFINQYTPLNFLVDKPISFSGFKIINLFLNIYFVLILANWGVYFVSGFLLDKLLGIHKVKEENILTIIEEIKTNIGIKGKVKVGFGKYPILNAMAYGSVFDKRIAIIANNINEIPKDELKGIIAHELSHTKGKHTLILTIITSIDLIVRMLLGIPATYYDYTFGNPQIPLVLFILLNLVIYFFLFIFVRILEGKADLRTKKVGYANELVKALYNLESFYATGRELGLNTMLLCEEKITEDNQLLDYMNTAKYLNRSMIKQSKISLLATFLNSHPPSYFRIAAILDSKMKPSKEAILPFICLRRSKQKKYALKFENAREKFKIIANEKFKEHFGIDNVPKLMEDIKRKELYQFEVKKDYIFRNLITDEIVIGKLKDIHFIDNITDPEVFFVQNLRSSQSILLNSSKYERFQFNMQEQYYFHKNAPLTLTDIEVYTNNKKGNYIFLDEKGKKIHKPIKKTKLSNSVFFIKNLKDQYIFLKKKGELHTYICKNINPTNKLSEFQIEMIDPKNPENNITFQLGELIIRPQNIFLSISRTEQFRKSEINIMNWLLKEKVLVYVYLKKPVNNLEIGYIQKIDVNTNNYKIDSPKDKKNHKVILFKNIFSKDIQIPYKEIEIVIFDFSSALIQIKSETSLTSRLGLKILKKIKPERIIIP
ncbi:MAG: M48 family metalloprotease [Promethearchaeota archaeon]